MNSIIFFNKGKILFINKATLQEAKERHKRLNRNKPTQSKAQTPVKTTKTQKVKSKQKQVCSQFKFFIATTTLPSTSKAFQTNQHLFKVQISSKTQTIQLSHEAKSHHQSNYHKKKSVFFPFPTKTFEPTTTSSKYGLSNSKISK